jgi:hypothetical protein
VDITKDTTTLYGAAKFFREIHAQGASVVGALRAVVGG